MQYCVRPQDGPQEMERNEAAANHVAWPTCAWLLHSFFPFPVGHSTAAPGTNALTLGMVGARHVMGRSLGKRVIVKSGRAWRIHSPIQMNVVSRDMGSIGDTASPGVLTVEALYPPLCRKSSWTPSLMKRNDFSDNKVWT